MSFLDYFKRSSGQATASVARERLQIIVAHQQRSGCGRPDYLSDLQKDLLAVISKYVAVDQDQVNVSLQKAGEQSVLELNITLPEPEDATA